MESRELLSGLFSMAVEKHIEAVTENDAFEDLPYIITYSGKKFRHLRPRAEDICIEDIAHALARVCRYTGHVDAAHYSVAQHSVLVSLHCNPKDALAGLLHDASEAYCSDISSPLKRLPGMEAYRIYEKRCAVAVADKFGVPVEKPKSVHVADLRIATNEMMSLFSASSMLRFADRTAFDWPPYEDLGVIAPWSSLHAEGLFLERFHEITMRMEYWQVP